MSIHSSSASAFTLTLAPANSRNQTATRAGRQIDRQDAQQPVRTTCCAWRGRTAARHNAVRSAQADEKDGGASHRVSRPPRCTPRAPSRHRNKSPADASVTRQGALPWPTRPVGTGQHAIAISITPLAAVHRDNSVSHEARKIDLFGSRSGSDTHALLPVLIDS